MTCKIIWTPEAEKDLAYWKKHDRKIIHKISDLIQSIQANPMLGIGKPERLKHKDLNLWSRRIDYRHRLVYWVQNDKTVYILQCRFHYDNC